MGISAGMISEIVTIPIDTAKVRLQIQNIIEGQKPQYKGFFGTIRTISVQEGPLALWSGLMPGLQKQVFWAGPRIGLYESMRNLICGEMKPGQNPTLLQKIGAGMVTGAVAITIANPTDLVKIRMQCQGQLPPAERPYDSMLDCY